LLHKSPKYEDIEIELSEPVHGLSSVKAVLGVPGWWPTGDRLGAVLAHDIGSNYDDAVLVELQRKLTEHRCLTLRFNFPFAEAKKKKGSTDTGAVLERCYRAAIRTMDVAPTAPAAHVFIGGIGLGARTAAHLACQRLKIEGAFFLGYPLHPESEPDNAQPEQLYRAVCPLLFLSGTRDRRCDLTVLRNCVRRSGTPTELRAIEEADQRMHLPKGSLRTPEDVTDEMCSHVLGWITRTLNLGPA